MNPLKLENYLVTYGYPLMIAGPCSAESYEQVREVAETLKDNQKVHIFRAGVWKPRTRPGSFEGVGDIALKWLQQIKKETQLLVATEVANQRHVESALAHDIDVLWIGARTAANPFSVQEIANALKGTGKIVMVKNPVSADLALWIGAMERISAAGINKIIAIHRGFSTGDHSKYRNNPKWKIPIELKRRYPELPIICDPSHIAGSRPLIAQICQRAMDSDMDGFMIETHTNPSSALSDAKQQITPDELKEIIKNTTLRRADCDERDFKNNLEDLRENINRIDEDMIDLLAKRFEIVEKIGEMKKSSGVTALQLDRFNQIMEKITLLADKNNLPEDLAREIFQTIHEKSIRRQTKIMKSDHD